MKTESIDATGNSCRLKSSTDKGRKEVARIVFPVMWNEVFDATWKEQN